MEEVGEGEEEEELMEVVVASGASPVGLGSGPLRRLASLEFVRTGLKICGGQRCCGKQIQISGLAIG